MWPLTSQCPPFGSCLPFRRTFDVNGRDRIQGRKHAHVPSCVNRINQSCQGSYTRFCHTELCGDRMNGRERAGYNRRLIHDAPPWVFAPRGKPLRLLFSGPVSHPVGPQTSLESPLSRAVSRQNFLLVRPSPTVPETATRVGREAFPLLSSPRAHLSTHEVVRFGACPWPASVCWGIIESCINNATLSAKKGAGPIA